MYVHIPTLLRRNLVIPTDVFWYLSLIGLKKTA
jgi:hypothetical protein